MRTWPYVPTMIISKAKPGMSQGCSLWNSCETHSTCVCTSRVSSHSSTLSTRALRVWELLARSWMARIGA